mmetsp:Transcript_342/g.720  ORF Transcript_342/g.720 Transcript_342/m.720 type:complete len:329 (-) Transcript_342:186-1172(-)
MPCSCFTRPVPKLFRQGLCLLCPRECRLSAQHSAEASEQIHLTRFIADRLADFQRLLCGRDSISALCQSSRLKSCCLCLLVAGLHEQCGRFFGVFSCLVFGTAHELLRQLLQGLSLPKLVALGFVVSKSLLADGRSSSSWAVFRTKDVQESDLSCFLSISITYLTEKPQGILYCRLAHTELFQVEPCVGHGCQRGSLHLLVSHLLEGAQGCHRMPHSHFGLRRKLCQSQGQGGRGLALLVAFQRGLCFLCSFCRLNGFAICEVGHGGQNAARSILASLFQRLGNAFLQYLRLCLGQQALSLVLLRRCLTSITLGEQLCTNPSAFWTRT